MMLNLLHDRRGCIFFAPDAGASSGGTTGGQVAGGGGSGGNATHTQEPEDPFKDLPWDELDDVTAQSLKKIQASHIATLQRAGQLETSLKQTDTLARRFQSELDRLKAEAEKSKQPPERDEYLESVKEQLQKSGFNPEEVNKMAPVFAGMFKSLAPQFKREVGQDLLPLAQTVLGREAESAFLHAKQNDPLKMLDEPKVAETVWSMVQERVKAGEQTNFGIVSNLAKIAWADHQAEVKINPDQPPLNPQPPNLKTGFTYPGAGNAPTFTPPSDPNAAKTSLNSDTEAALATTFRHMGASTGVYPKKFQPSTKTRRK